MGLFDSFQKALYNSAFSFKYWENRRLASDMQLVLSDAESRKLFIEAENATHEHLDNSFFSMLESLTGSFLLGELASIGYLASLYDCPKTAKLCFDKCILLNPGPLTFRTDHTLFFLFGKFMAANDLIKHLNEIFIPKESKWNMSVKFTALLDGILASERYPLYRQFHEMALRKLSLFNPGPTSNHKTLIDPGSLFDIKRNLTKQFHPNDWVIKSDDKTFEDSFKNNNRIDELSRVTVDLSLFLMGHENHVEAAFEHLSLQLEIELDKKEMGLAKQLKEQFPAPKNKTIQMDWREYPSLNDLNPNSVSLKKFSTLKNLLCKILQQHDLIDKNLAAPDKYLGFVVTNETSRSGLFTESLLSMLNHGKLSHLIQWYCIAWAVDNNKLSIKPFSLKELLQAFISARNNQDKTLWSDVLDVYTYMFGYCSPLNVFSHLLNADNCLGSYTRASFSNQLNKLTKLYAKLPETSVSNAPQITPDILCTHTTLLRVYGDTFQASINQTTWKGLFNATHDHYKQSHPECNIVPGGNRAWVIKTPKSSP